MQQHWIDALCEPRALYLAWQPSDLTASRTRWAVGLVRPHGEDFELRYFGPGDEFSKLNLGKSFDELRSLGYVGYPAFSLEQEMHREGVRSALLRRLPPRRRSDFSEYAEQFRLRPGVQISDFALLARTEAKLPSDGFSLIDPLDPDAERCDLLLEVAGYRHTQYQEARQAVQIGSAAQLVPEPDNPYDPEAVKVVVGGLKIGNVNRLQSATFLRWFETREVEATVERLNGSAERPRAYVFVRVSPMHVRRAA